MRHLKNPCEVAVIGGGLAGLSAARHAVRLGRLVTLFEGSGLFGGQIATTGEVDGLPLPGTFSGQDVAMGMLEQIRKAGVRVVETEVTTLDPGERLMLTDAGGRRHHPEAVIVASGAALRKLAVPGAEGYEGRGLSHCATCDGSFFRGQDVVVTGAGDSAFQEALVLARTARRVIMVCRGNVRARRDYVDRLTACENVTYVWDAEVVGILGEGGVTGVRVRGMAGGEVTEIACAGIFPFIGTAPRTAFLPQRFLTGSGHVRAGCDLATADPRIFAAGAVRDGFGGDAAQALAEGVGAAQAAGVKSLQWI